MAREAKELSVKRQLGRYGETAKGVIAVSRKKARKLLGYTAATGAALAAAPAADADIVYSGPNQNLMALGGQTVSLDLDGDATIDFFFRNSYTGTLYAYVDPGAGNAVIVPTATPGIAKNLSLNFTIGPTLPATASFNPFGSKALNTYSGSYGQFLTSNTGFLGARFKIGGNDHFGWIRVHTEPIKITVQDWAYESSPNTAIKAGAIAAIPEASAVTGLSLIALGYAGVRTYKRLRSKQEQEA